MVIFLDTSTLVKLYFTEDDSIELMDKIFTKVTQIYLSKLSKIEFVSALWKKVRMGDIEKDICLKIIEHFKHDEDKYNWIENIDDKFVETAINLLKKYGLQKLKSLDAMQLASALLIKNKVDVFLTNDIFLKKLFEAENLKTEL